MTTAASTTIDAAELENLLASGEQVTLLDVRSPAEFETAHIKGAVNVPVDVVGQRSREVAERLDGNVVVICQQGPRATQACQNLAGVGIAHARILEGGMGRYDDGVRAVERGKQRWALERQVRGVAGSMVLIGVAASFAWPPAIFLAGFVGAGLTFSALSNTCTMGDILSKLPYNQSADYDADAELARLGH